MTLLDHLKIIDVSRGPAGPLATQVLADFGAAIVRVDEPGAARTPSDIVRLRGRKSIAIDLGQAGGQALLESLAAAADVLITEPGLGGQDPVQSSFATLHAQNPRL